MKKKIVFSVAAVLTLIGQGAVVASAYLMDHGGLASALFIGGVILVVDAVAVVVVAYGDPAV